MSLLRIVYLSFIGIYIQTYCRCTSVINWSWTSKHDLCCLSLKFIIISCKIDHVLLPLI